MNGFIDGFLEKCAHYGINPHWVLQKLAQNDYEQASDQYNPEQQQQPAQQYTPMELPASDTPQLKTPPPSAWQPPQQPGMMGMAPQPNPLMTNPMMAANQQ